MEYRELDPPENSEEKCSVCEDWFEEDELKLVDTKKIYCHICNKCERDLNCSTDKKLEKKLERLDKEKNEYKKTRIWKKEGKKWSYITKLKENGRKDKRD